jgi:hypothetical protein
VSERRWALEIDSILLVDSSIGRPCTSLVARGERRRSSSTRSRRAYRRCAIQPAIWDALEAGRRTTARRSSATSSSASTPSRTRTTHSAPSRRARRQRDPPADCQALGGELLLALERDALCTTVGSITDPGSHVAHGGRPSLILDLISADCTRRARSTLIRTRSPTPRPRSSQPLERDELCALVDSTTDPGSHVAHGGRPSTCAVFPPCPAVCSRPCLMCASPAALARRMHGGLRFVGLSPRASLVRLCTPNRSHKSFSQSRRKSKVPNKSKVAEQ